MKIFAPQAARANLVKRDGCLLHEIIMVAPLSMSMDALLFSCRKMSWKIRKNVMECHGNVMEFDFRKFLGTLNLPIYLRLHINYTDIYGCFKAIGMTLDIAKPLPKNSVYTFSMIGYQNLCHSQ